MKISKREFGALPDGAKVTCFCIENDAELCAEVLDYGATIRSIIVPDRNGTPTDVVLGYDDLDGYISNRGFYGATVGRFANRIAGAEFELNGKSYTLAKNNGENYLHGGIKGYDKRIWQANEEADGVLFELTSPNGEEGYPGTLCVQVKVAWNGNGLMLHYRAKCDKDTILNLTNHSYFNLNGTGDVQTQLLKINAEQYTVNDAQCLPTGEIADVLDSAMDFRSFKPIGNKVLSAR